MSNSPTTGFPFYSGNWTDIQALCRVLNIGEGKLSKVTQSLVELYQEMVDREIDSVLADLYYVPLKPFNQVQPDGTTKAVFPGDVRRLARYWTAGLLMHSEFQGLDPNTNESVNQYIEDSRKELFRMIAMNHRIQGQEFKAGIRTMPPTFMPTTKPEPDY